VSPLSGGMIRVCGDWSVRSITAGLDGSGMALG
jgi:hypothetical protein